MFFLLFIEIDSCHDNCGKITNGMGCSCDWECHYSDNCCQDLKIYCPYSKYFIEVFIIIQKLQLC